MMMIWSLILMHFEFKKAELQDCLTQVICWGENGNWWVSSFYHHQRTDSRTHCSCCGIWWVIWRFTLFLPSSTYLIVGGQLKQQEKSDRRSCGGYLPITRHFYSVHNSSLFGVCGRFYMESSLTFFFHLTYASRMMCGQSECNAAGWKRVSSADHLLYWWAFSGVG